MTAKCPLAALCGLLVLFERFVGERHEALLRGVQRLGGDLDEARLFGFRTLRLRRLCGGEFGGEAQILLPERGEFGDGAIALGADGIYARRTVGEPGRRPDCGQRQEKQKRFGHVGSLAVRRSRPHARLI